MVTRFLKHVDQAGPTPAHRPDLGPCWLWLGATQNRGYGRFYTGVGKRGKHGSGGMSLAHRVAYELIVGSIPDDQTIDHLCFNKRCVNPSHLEVVPERVNFMRGQPRHRAALKLSGMVAEPAQNVSIL